MLLTLMTLESVPVSAFARGPLAKAIRAKNISSAINEEELANCRGPKDIGHHGTSFITYSIMFAGLERRADSRFT